MAGYFIKRGVDACCIALVLLAVFWSASPTVSHATEAAKSDTGPVLRLGVIGDQTGTRDMKTSYRILEQGVEKLNAMKPDVVIQLGDLLESSKPEHAVRQDFRAATSILNRLDAPWLMTAGDHDVNPVNRQQNSADRSREALFLDLYGDLNNRIGNTPYYAQVHNDWLLISLFSHEVLHADPRWGNIFLARISDTQLSWLEQTLLAHTDVVGRVVFIHQPLWYQWGDWKRVHDLLARYEVDLVVAGHFHYSQDEGTRDGVRYIVHGATGGRTKTGSVKAGSVHLVSLIELSADRISITPKSVLGAPLDYFPERALMDRVHNVDVALSVITMGLRGKTFYMRNDVAYSDCSDAASEAAFEIPRLANPIDRPLTVKLVDPQDAFRTPAFAPGICLNLSDDSENQCILPPSQGIAASNVSSVRLLPASPLADLRMLTSAAVPDGTIDVTLKASFDWAGEVITLTQSQPIKIEFCTVE